MAGNFIAKAIEHPGSFSKKAKSAGMSTMGYARKELHASGRTGKQARLAETLAKLRRKKK